MGFWWPMSEMPEQGFCEMTKESAEGFIDAMCVANSAYKREDFTIEPYDSVLSERLCRHQIK